MNKRQTIEKNRGHDWRGLRDWFAGSPRDADHPNWPKLRRSYRRWRVFGAPSFLAATFGVLWCAGGTDAVLGGLGCLAAVGFFFAAFFLLDRIFP